MYFNCKSRNCITGKAKVMEFVGNQFTPVGIHLLTSLGCTLGGTAGGSTEDPVERLRRYNSNMTDNTAAHWIDRLFTHAPTARNNRKCFMLLTLKHWSVTQTANAHNPSASQWQVYNTHEQEVLPTSTKTTIMSHPERWTAPCLNGRQHCYFSVNHDSYISAKHSLSKQYILTKSVV